MEGRIRCIYILTYLHAHPSLLPPPREHLMHAHTYLHANPHTHTHKPKPTGRSFTAAEAQALGLLSRVLPTPDAALAAAEALAAEIASKSPVAVVGTKVNLNYARDHSTRDALDYITTWNAGMLQTQDVERSVVAAMSKGKAEFSKL